MTVPDGPAAAGRSPAIVISGAALRFGDTCHFAGLDLTLDGGRTTCLLGPSGIGKTSLLKLIAGLPAAGLSGTVSAGDGAPLAGRIAMMAQRDHLLPWARLIDNTMLGARLRGEAPDESRARAILTRLGLGPAIDLRPEALSGGMRQRAALARTLYEDRPVVLMDEPFSALDAVTRHRLQEVTARALAGRTVLLVTHDPAEALRLGDRVLVLNSRPGALREIEVPGGAIPRDQARGDFAAALGRLFESLGDGGAQG
ncbi:ABC transporter ATP-binding protein [Zavarzinia aquatilis]|uniref:ABC transporter ATP-binding protein n=1 Tax=Zavarzinia aquatilis TaxID=2211142 RepID=A0A317EKP4_9PROT|nr:ABC transporter ATP-binding protein [Zavarzinia aquatilis]PWR26023.1 ABC transporter ATP-binding protein [Zavarzinia aquatilis]